MSQSKSLGIRYRNCLLVALLGILVWAAATWPLPLHFGSAIPHTERRAPAAPAVEELVPGDHIQLLYHFWLFRDMVSGHTPPFSNVYEFNMGDDGARRKFDPYYVPFSAVYALVSPLLGHAAGWNAAGLFSVLLGIFGFFALSRRYTDSPLLAVAAATVATAFPYRWFALLGGSPTGFAMSFLPWLLYGIDRAVRSKSPAGGLVAGLALLAAYCSDLHVFYFSILATPAWCVFAWLADTEPLIPSPRRVGRIALSLAPLAFCAVLAAAAALFASDNLGGTNMAGGRALRELRLFSPIRSGLFRWESLAGTANQIFVGASLVLLLAFGYALFALELIRCCRAGGTEGQARGPVARTPLLVVLLTLAVVSAFLLSLGTNGPHDALPIRLARRLLPKYTMIRQPAKVFCLLPALLAVLGTLLFGVAGRRCASAGHPAAGRGPRTMGRAAIACALVLALAAIAEETAWFHAGLCRLPASLPAYSAVAADAKARGVEAPRAIALTLWPGDSHYSALYEYGAMTSRLRLLNGYSPSVSQDYMAFADRLHTLSQGELTNAQADLLRSIGVRYVLFHESPYPRKVSPFPAGVALRRLRANPLLEPVASDGPVVLPGEAVWAFALRDAHATNGTVALPAIPFPASTHWDGTRLARTCHRGGTATNYLLQVRGAVASAPDLRYEMLLSGGGKLRSPSGKEVVAPVKPAWVAAPFTPPYGDSWLVVEGEPVMGHALIAGGETTTGLQPGASIVWSAADLFHDAPSDAAGTVWFRSQDFRPGIALEGPSLPFPAGDYTATLVAHSVPSLDSVVCGAITAETIGDGGRLLADPVPVRVGAPTTISFRHDGLLPLRFAFHFDKYVGRDDVAIGVVRLEVRRQR